MNIDLITDDFYIAPGSYVLKIQTEENGNYGITALGPYRSWVVFETPYMSIMGEKELNFSINPPENTKSGDYKFLIMVYKIEDDSYFLKEEYTLIIKTDTK